MKDYTSIQINKSTRNRLGETGKKNQTYNQIINMLLDHYHGNDTILDRLAELKINEPNNNNYENGQIDAYYYTLLLMGLSSEDIENKLKHKINLLQK